jgi:hypothetical protein
MMSKMKSNDRAGAPVAADTTTAVQAKGRRKKHLLTFALTVIVAWGLGTFAYIYFYPHLLYNRIERAE